MDEENVILHTHTHTHTHTFSLSLQGILFSLKKKEGTPFTCNNIQPGGHYANNQTQKETSPHNLTYMWNLKK